MRLLILLTPLLLIGCMSAPKEITTVTQTEYITYSVPENLLKPCPVTKPIAIKDYMGLSQEGRERELTNYVVRLLGDLRNCNESKEAVKKFIERKLEGMPTNTKVD